MSDESIIEEYNEEKMFKFKQLNRRTLRLACLIVAFIVGYIVFFYESLCLRVLGSDYYGANYGFPATIDFVSFIVVVAIGLALYAEWCIIQEERKAYYKEYHPEGVS